jgi:pimeloyl-ACP methyl ester carboxylesterase
VRYDDWGERSARWAGIRSEVVDVHGTSVHLLRADASSHAPPDAPTHLLIHPMASGATFWLDVLGPLTAHGPVLAPDLPGAAFGHTAAPNPSAARAEPSARFLRALTSTLGLDQVVAHGWSFGGLVALLSADQEPGRVHRLVLTNPTLPGPMTAAERAAWQTLGRLAVFIGPWLVRGLLRALGPRLVDLKKQRFANPNVLSASRLDVAGGDLSRCSPELVALLAKQLEELRSQPRRLRGGVVAFASALSAMFIDQRPAGEAIGRLSAPTLLLWGDQDPLIERGVIDHLIARRPDWELRVFETVGHLPPWEVPEAYVEAVGGWLAKHDVPPGGDTDLNTRKA